MNSMSEFMNRELIKEKIDEISDKFFDFQIIDSEIYQEVEDDMDLLIKALAESTAKHGEIEDTWPIIIAYLMDTIVAQLIVIKLQNKFVEKCKRDRRNDDE